MTTYTLTEADPTDKWPKWFKDLAAEKSASFPKSNSKANLAAPSTSPEPMTHTEAMDLLPTNTSMSRTDALIWMLRATERHHKIGAKPQAAPSTSPLTVEEILHTVDTHVGVPSARHPLENSDWINLARAIEARINLGRAIEAKIKGGA